MRDFFHYTLEKNIPGILKIGVYANHPYYTTTEYFSATDAGQELGVMPHNIDCVLKFKDDGQFKRFQDVPATGRFRGGGNQFQHPSKLKPIAKRKITERMWTNI